jgi:glycosyltransferase involved in cell wall biosynthesis
VAKTRLGLAWLVMRAFDSLPFYFFATLEVFRLAREGDVVVVKTDPPLIGILVATAARLRGARLVNWLQDVYPEVAAGVGIRAGRGIFGALLAAARDLSLRIADCNVALGERMAAFLESRGVSRRRVNVIHNWADDDAIVPIESGANAFTAQFGLHGKFVVAYSGNLGRVHHFDTMLDAAELLASDSRVVFLIIGQGVQLEPVKAEAQRRGLQRFLFLPHQPRERLGLSLTAAQLHLVTLSPQLEGLVVPSKFYGIAAAGRPVAFIGDEDGEIARIIARHDCGRSFVVGDSVGLAEYVRFLAAHPEEVMRQGANARAALERHYSKAAAFGAWKQTLLAPQYATNETVPDGTGKSAA